MSPARRLSPNLSTALWAIARTTFKVGLRGRLMTVLGGVALLLIGTAIVGYEMSPSLKTRLLCDMGLSMASFVGGVLSATLMINTFTHELSGRQAEPLLVRPIGRGVALIGKWLGIVMLALLFVGGVATATVGTLALSGCTVSALLGQAFGLVGLELIVISALTLLAATLGSQAFASSMVATFCLAGNLSDDILALAQRHPSPGCKALAQIVFHILPDLGRLSLRSAIANGVNAPRPLLGWACLYAAGYSGVCVALATIAYRRRDTLRSL